MMIKQYDRCRSFLLDCCHIVDLVAFQTSRFASEFHKSIGLFVFPVSRGGHSRPGRPRSFQVSGFDLVNMVFFLHVVGLMTSLFTRAELRLQPIIHGSLVISVGIANLA